MSCGTIRAITRVIIPKVKIKVKIIEIGLINFLNFFDFILFRSFSMKFIGIVSTNAIAALTIKGVITPIIFKNIALIASI